MINFIESENMVYEKLSEEEIKEVFKILNIQNTSTDKHFQVWEVPPIPKGARITINTK